MESLKSKSQKYHLLGEKEVEDHDCEDSRPLSKYQQPWLSFIYVLLSVFGLVMLSGAAGYSIGRASTTERAVSPVKCMDFLLPQEEVMLRACRRNDHQRVYLQ